MRKSKEPRKATGGENQSEKMSSKSSENLSDRSSPDPNCSICLSKMKDKSFTDRCFHMFCFECLVEWSKINAVCPLCKQPFKQIFHNIRSMSDYDVYDVASHSSVLPLISSRGPSAAAVAAPSNTSQPMLTNRHDVNLFLSQTSNQLAFSEWLSGHVREFVRVDALQAAYVSNLVVDLLRVWCISSEHFYESLTPFFASEALDFIHSLDRHLHRFMRQESGEHALETALQRLSSRTGRSTTTTSVSRRSPVADVPTVTVHQRTSRNSNGSRLLLDGVVRSNAPDPGTSRFSVLLSIVRPSAVARIGNANASSSSSSSSSSSPREDELIDIERLEEGRSEACRSPICVSSGDEGHVQLVECSSRTRPRHPRKRRPQTFLLVSSDDEAAVVAEGRKRMKLVDSKPDSRVESENAPARSNAQEMKVTFKKHPTGHKNSLKCRKTAGSRNDEQNGEEKFANPEVKAEGESTGDNVTPGSSSSQNISSLKRENLDSPPSDGTPNKMETEGANGEERVSPPNEASVGRGRTCVVLDDTLDAEQLVEAEDPIDVDTISVYSDDSIEWIEDVPVEIRRRRSGNAETDADDLEIVEAKSSDIAKPRSVDGRKELLFVDLSDEDDDDTEEKADLESEPSQTKVSTPSPSSPPRGGSEGCSTSLEVDLPSLGVEADVECDPLDLSFEREAL